MGDSRLYRRLDEKIEAIKATFAPLMHEEFMSFETAELQFEDGTWGAWRDLPIRMYGAGELVSISWWNLDDLWLANDATSPFPAEGLDVRWIENANDEWKTVLGDRFNAVLIGRGEMSIEETDVEIWTRLVIQVGEHWIEIFNALDENGFDFHSHMPDGEFVRCL
jgi:hypothetical protein